MYTPIPEAIKPVFYVADIRSHDSILLGKHLNLPQALSLYGSFPADRTPVLGVMRNGKPDAELVRRINRHSVLVTDYQQDDRWRYNRELCVSAVNMIVCTLHVRHQMKTGEAPEPLRERVHVLQLKDEPEADDLRFMDMDWLKKKAIAADIDNYTLVFSEDVQPGFDPEGLFIRYNSGRHPEGYRGYSLSVSDVLVYQNHKGCEAHYIDRIGCAWIQGFVKPPGGKEITPSEKKRTNIKEVR